MNSIETRIGRVLVGKILPNEEIIDSVNEMVVKHEIKSGLVNIIGALNKVTIGIFDLEKKEYNFQTFNENVELISCMGNIAYKDMEPIIHLHVSIGREDFSIIGGHLSQPSNVSVTSEVYIYEVDQKLTRSEDSQFGLSLLNL